MLRRLNGGPLRGMVSSRQGPVHRWEYRRGFIESLTVRPSAFLSHGEELLGIGPIQEVRLVHEAVPCGEIALSPLLKRIRTLVVRRCDQGGHTGLLDGLQRLKKLAAVEVVG